MSAAVRPGAAFYCVSDARFFVGLAGMINSLRIQGHGEPVFVLDLGLEPWQRDLLAGEATVVRADPAAPPTMMKAVAPLAHPAETMVLIDADVILTRSLAELIERAGTRSIVGFRDAADRFLPEWGALLGVGEATERPYLSAGLLICGAEPGEQLMRGLERHRGSVDFARTWALENDVEYPFVYGDQDLLNALLATVLAAAPVEALDARLLCALPFGGVAPTDVRALRCAYPDGLEPYGLHHILPAKPWTRPLYDGVYSRLLRRALTGPGLAIEIPARRLPVRLRGGPLAELERRRINTRDRLGWVVRRRLPRVAMARLDDRRRRRAVTRG